VSGPVIIAGEFELDSDRHELRHQGRRVALRPTPFRLLLHLVKHRDRTVSKQELLEAVWPGVIVSDMALASALNLAREALDDDGRTQRSIKTRRGFGYEFVGAVEECGQTNEPGAIPSLAVLPLENLSGDPEQEYFGDGLTEALIGDLARIPGLHVISRTSVMHYKATLKTIPEIAQELSVDYLIEGSFSRSGENVHVSAQLIDASDDYHLWAQTYDQDMSDGLAIQRDVARAVAQQMRIELAPEVSEDLAAIRQVNPRAQEAVFKAEFQFQSNNLGNILKAAAYYEEAIEIDPTYAAPLAGLAAMSLWQAGEVRPAHEEMPKTKETALKALALDERQSEAHKVLGWINLYYELDWEGAEEQFADCRRLNSSNYGAYRGSAEVLSSLGMHDDAQRMVDRCFALNPLDPLNRDACAQLLFVARKFEQAIEESRLALEVNPNLGMAWSNLAYAYLCTGRVDEALDAYLRCLEAHALAARSVRVDFREARDRDGLRGFAQAFLSWYRDLPDRKYFSPLRIAPWVAASGDTDQALDLVQRGCRERARGIHNLRVNPVWDPLRDDPRFEDLCSRMGIPQPELPIAGTLAP
jgi:TolB-like protein/Tfp pilus assembly protein PilF